MATKAIKKKITSPTVQQETLDSTLIQDMSQEQQLKLALENTVNVANYFGSAIQTQEKAMLNLNLPPKITILWVLKNRKKFFEFVEFIIAIIKEVRQKIDEIKNAQESAPKN